MRTWSLERAIVGVVSGVAVAVQGFIDATRTGPCHRYDKPHQGAEQLNSLEEEQDSFEPGDPRLRCAAAASVNGKPFLCELPSVHAHSAHHNTFNRTFWIGPADNGVAADELFAAGEEDGPNPYEPQLSDSERLSEAEEQQDAWEAGELTCPFCQSSECRDPECRAEPPLSDDELVSVRQLIEERFPLQPLLRTQPGMGCTGGPLEDVFRSGGQMWCMYCGRPGGCGGECAGSKAAALREGRTSSSVEGEPLGASATASGTSGEAVSGADPRTPPASPHSNIESLIPGLRNLLTNHIFRYADHPSSIGSAGQCSCGARPVDQYEWREHIAPLIAQRVGAHGTYIKRGPMGESVPVQVETGQDFGASLACELFPQHKRQK